MSKEGSGVPFCVVKKPGYAGLFRQELKRCLRPGAPNSPPGKAGQYDFILEGLRALQAS